MTLSVDEAARVMGGSVVSHAESIPVAGAVIDSRTVESGNLFFALEGESLDGHDFVDDALDRGAAAAVVTTLREDVDPGRQIVVGNPVAAMVLLARHIRGSIDPAVVGITGSTGKTSVKDLLASILATKKKVVASEGSFNNELGLPLTLLRIRPDTEIVVCEMGARGPGQIKLLCDLARPDVGVVTNVGVTHYELFGSREAIAAGKSELVQSLPKDGSAVLNFDDPLVRAMAAKTRAEVVSYGLAPGARLRAEAVTTDRLGRPSFRMIRGDEEVDVSLAVSGGHQVMNSLAAAAAGMVLGLTLEECRDGLARARVSRWRMEALQIGGVVVVNDAYNANPTSVASALTSCAGMVAEGGRFVAVLGFMAELGEIEAAEHRRVGALAASTAQRLVVVGKDAAPIAEGAVEAGMAAAAVVRVDSPADALAAAGELGPGDVVLVKGSRVAALEGLARQIEERLSR